MSEGESVRFWRLNSLAALKMMDLNERQAETPGDLAAIRTAKAEKRELEARENAVKTRHRRIISRKHEP